MLRVEKLSTFYGNIQALRDITIRARRGSITTIIGANGAGKSTLCARSPASTGPGTDWLSTTTTT